MREIFNSKFVKVIVILIMLAGIIALSAWGYVSIKELLAKGSSDRTEQESKNYIISYGVSGDGTNLTNKSIDGPTQAKAGEIIFFKVNLYDENYTIAGFQVFTPTSVVKAPEISVSGNGYKFTMPECNVDIFIELKYTAVSDVKTYRIEYDSLGWASMEIVYLKCPDRAAAGESVSFVAQVKENYANEYKISHVVVRLGSGEDYIDDLPFDSGLYTFRMPDTATMESEINEGYITLMFYIIPIDM